MKIGRCQHLYSSIAQSVERMTVNHDVTGSSPVGGAKNSLQLIGVDDAEGPPVPIPNTEVKPCSADDSCPATGCENRKTPILVVSFYFKLIRGQFFLPSFLFLVNTDIMIF